MPRESGCRQEEASHRPIASNPKHEKVVEVVEDQIGLADEGANADEPIT